MVAAMPGVMTGFAAIGEMHGAFTVDDIECLIGVVAVHVVCVAGLGVNMHPRVKPVGVEDLLAFAFSGLFDHIDDFNRHSSSLMIRRQLYISARRQCQIPRCCGFTFKIDFVITFGPLNYLAEEANMSMNWGMANRLARIIKADGRAVMLAVDHGYFLGPTSGLEEPRKTIEPLMPHADSIMLTRGVLRTSVDAKADKPIVLRVSGGTSILKELSNEDITVSIDDCIRLERLGDGAVDLCRLGLRERNFGQSRPSSSMKARSTASRCSPLPRSAKIWRATCAISACPAVSPRKWARISSRPTTATISKS